MYATASELRARYRRGDDRIDEFELRTDGDLTAALAAAGAEIDSYRPAGALSVAATAVLRDKCLTLARMLVHQDEALSEEHPIVRDGKAVRAWLVLLAKRIVLLPADVAADETDPPPVYAAPVRTLALGTLEGYDP